MTGSEGPPAAGFQPAADPTRDPPRGAVRVTVTLTDRALDIAEVLAAVSHPEAGGIGIFAGAVRDHHEGAAVAGITYEAWEEEAGSAMRAVADDVAAAFPGVRAVAIAHRIGEHAIGDLSVIVAASAPHRQEALDAARRLIDEVKERVPIWKHEHLVGGGSRWTGTPDPGT